jgi:cbb3-type cytochrome oxidase maturation protein
LRFWTGLDSVVESLYLLIPLSVLLALAIGAVFWWAVRSGQFEDLEGPAHRVLMDDENEARSKD